LDGVKFPIVIKVPNHTFALPLRAALPAMSVNAGANFHHLAGAKIHQFGVAEGCPSPKQSLRLTLHSNGGLRLMLD